MGRSNSKEANSSSISDVSSAKTRKTKKVLKEKRKSEKLSKKKKRKSKLNDCQETIAPHVIRKGSKPLDEKDYDAEVKRRMQDQLAFDSDIFVLNQIMLSIQFFGHYEREMFEAVERNCRLENQFTNNITKHCKTVILSDRLFDAIDKNVKFNAKHGHFKNKLLSLNGQTLYVVHENIEITNPGETSVYSILTDAPVYKMEIEDYINEKNRFRCHRGYVKLKSAEFIRKSFVKSENFYNQSIESELSKSEDDLDEIDDGKARVKHFDAMKFKENLAKKATSQHIYNQSSSSTSPASSEYDYAYITALNTPQPLNKVIGSSSSSTVALPDACIVTVNCSSEMNDGYYSDDESDSEMDKVKYKKSQKEYTNELKQYLNSKEFLSHFMNIFQETFAGSLGFEKVDLDTATWRGASIYAGGWEIIPAISGPWPRDAQEWLYRKRDVKENPLTGQKFQWPTPPMVNKVKAFGCHVVPVGYAPKVGTNKYRQFEWKIIFPEAERYLESCLTYTQTKIYAITKALIKSFIDPNLNAGLNMFTSEHLKTHLFWQCEINYAAWPEDYLGEALIRFLNALLECIKTHTLPDYFIPERNLFENIPEKVLVELHKRIFRITENPVMHILVAMRNMKFMNGRKKFYPKLRLKRLYSILIIANPLKIVDPKYKDNDINLAAEDSEDESEMERIHAFGSMAYIDKQEQESKKKRAKIVKFLEAERIKRDGEKFGDRKESLESIDIKFIPLKHMESLRRQLLYHTFIKQFIEMATVSQIFRSFSQGKIYLKQAERLCGLLSDDKGKDDAQKYLKEINQLRIALTDLSNSNTEGPALPLRESGFTKKKSIRVKRKSSKSSLSGRSSPYKNAEMIKNNSKDQKKRSQKKIVTKIQVHNQTNHCAIDQNKVMKSVDELAHRLGNVAVN